MNKLLLRPAVKPVLWILLALPALWLGYAAANDLLGANPAEALIRSLGDWTLRALCLTLALTPLRQLTGWSGLVRLRRNIGVSVFIYGTLHWLAYAVFDQGLDVAAILKDIAKRPFILVGTAAWLALMPLAATSFNAAVRKMGGRAWRDLHKLTYAIGPIALLHFLWMRAGKNNFGEVTVYALIIGALLAWRWWRRSDSPPRGMAKA